KCNDWTGKIAQYIVLMCSKNVEHYSRTSHTFRCQRMVLNMMLLLTRECTRHFLSAAELYIKKYMEEEMYLTMSQKIRK
ncbi:hypothetical protein L9F63_020010, partial [Diploptera punctata]